MFGDRMVIYTYLADNVTSSNRRLSLLSLFVLQFHRVVACPHMFEAEVGGSGFNWQKVFESRVWHHCQHVLFISYKVIEWFYCEQSL